MSRVRFSLAAIYGTVHAPPIYRAIYRRTIKRRWNRAAQSLQKWGPPLPTTIFIFYIGYRMLIRKAAAGDLAAIDRIYNQSVAAKFIVADLTPFTAAKRAEWFREHGERYPVLVAERTEGSGIIGFLSLSPYRPGREAVKQTAEASYFVDESSRRTGVAGALLTHAEAMCGELGIKTLFAVIIDRNAPSIAFIEKHGYRRWGHLPGVAVFDGSEAGHLYYGKRIAP